MAHSDTQNALVTSETLLRKAFAQKGYVRYKNEKRSNLEGYDCYKKGYEVRLIARSEAELADLMAALSAFGFRAGRAFLKAKQWVLPLYGRVEVERFLRLVKADTLADKVALPPR